MYMWKNGLNFSQRKYKILNEHSFIPHIRSNYSVSIPRLILENLKADLTEKNIAMVKISDRESKISTARIKKLHKCSGNSLLLSFKAEKNFKLPIVDVIKVVSENEALKRKRIINKNKISISSVTPKMTSGRTPIYIVKDGNNLLIGGYYKKDILCKSEVTLDENALSSIGLYYCEGGTKSASFTNSWPVAINQILDFIENVFNLDRKEIKASIYCNPILKEKQRNLEEFWISETGIENFSGNLHLGKNSRSPQGTLELYFCSEVIKEIMRAIIAQIHNYNFEMKCLIRGILSGDGTPLLHTKYTINHHVAYNGAENNYIFLKSAFQEFRVSRLKTQNRFVIKTNWVDNKNLLLMDPYKFNLTNRIKFVKRFLSLPRSRDSSAMELKYFRNNYYKKIYKDAERYLKRLQQLELINENLLTRLENDFKLS